jgi:hypothetical protein
MNNVQGLIKQITGVDIFQETRKQEVVEYRAVANLFLEQDTWVQLNGHS